MAFDEGMAQTLRDELTALAPLREVRMFGGLCFMWRGNMLCGIHKAGALFRVGPHAMATALALPGVAPMTMTGRAMKAIVDCGPKSFADDAIRARLLALSRDFVDCLPAK